MFDAINKASNDIKDLLSLVERDISSFFASNMYARDTVFVVNDKITKMWKIIDKERQKIDSILVSFIEKIEKYLKGYRTACCCSNSCYCCFSDNTALQLDT